MMLKPGDTLSLDLISNKGAFTNTLSDEEPAQHFNGY